MVTHKMFGIIRTRTKTIFPAGNIKLVHSKSKTGDINLTFILEYMYMKHCLNKINKYLNKINTLIEYYKPSMNIIYTH